MSAIFNSPPVPRAAVIGPSAQLPDARTDRFLRRPEVQHLTGLSRTSLYRQISEGRFPRPVRLSTNSVAWTESEIRHWMRERVETSRSSEAQALNARAHAREDFETRNSTPKAINLHQDSRELRGGP